MQKQQNLANDRSRPFQPRQKAQSFKQSKTTEEDSFANLEKFTLSSSMEISHHTKRFNLQNLLEYLHDVLGKLYDKDVINLKETFNCFLKNKLVELKAKMQERLALLKYLEESLKYKSFTEIDVEIQKEWRKNALLFSISTIWARCMLAHVFKSQEEFAVQYQKFRTFVARLTQFYFKYSLKVLNSKNVDTLVLIYEDTSHQIINNLKDWKEIYEKVLLQVMDSRIKTCHPEKGNAFDLGKLKINEDYLNSQEQENQLKQTTRFIQELTRQHRIHEQINILKKIRATFLAEITENSNRIKEELSLTHVSQFEKDDILDCMIYCIVKGEIYTLDRNIRALILLLGKNSDLLSKRGVDSYRADLQAAAQYLEEERIGMHNH